MNSRFGLFLCGILLAVCACEPVAVQYPPGSAQYPYPNPSGPTTPQAPQVSGSQRWQHAWNKAMEGVAMGGSIGGPYGAGGGLIIGLITGLMTAESHFAQMNSRIQSEQAKDRELEAQIERELERQRELETQVAGVGPAAPARGKKEPPSPPPMSQSVQ